MKRLNKDDLAMISGGIISGIGYNEELDQYYFSSCFGARILDPVLDQYLIEYFEEHKTPNSDFVIF